MWGGRGKCQLASRTAQTAEVAQVADMLRRVAPCCALWRGLGAKADAKGGGMRRKTRSGWTGWPWVRLAPVWWSLWRNVAPCCALLRGRVGGGFVWRRRAAVEGEGQKAKCKREGVSEAWGGLGCVEGVLAGWAGVCLPPAGWPGWPSGWRVDARGGSRRFPPLDWCCGGRVFETYELYG